jgi:hypothetical protein
VVEAATYTPSILSFEEQVLRNLQADAVRRNLLSEKLEAVGTGAEPTPSTAA